ncbi:short-chain dehydrogenase [Pseudorhizobium endolithicum]|uniref:Short-chain dehydrogenase n=1 Tax=Pseudorhizobium endolithicum TaxID=1191678 RepID=A0ABN7JHK4_9HYPH|nr:SDR family oxidoreductase [Pseudorhizobium endolithicum]CAD7031688.1 short-chain dehydrogenase [Pseudorhizobium endolithicum]
MVEESAAPAPVAGRVVVITGASSGIGRATALEFSRANVALVLSARNREQLELVAEECRKLGALVLTLPADVSISDQVSKLGDAAVAAFGRIDVWLNCAAVLMFGPVLDESLEPFRRVIDVNLFGYVNGTRTALQHFQRQEGGGVLINGASMLGKSGEPFLGAYVASKAAIIGFTTCVRQEMRDFQHIQVCTILPVAIDTPIYQKAANHMGKPARCLPAVYAVQRVAKAIVRVSEQPRAEVIVGSYGHLLNIALKLFPRLTERLIARLAPRLQFDEGSEDEHDGNLYQPAGPNTVGGGWRNYWRSKAGLLRM